MEDIAPTITLRTGRGGYEMLSEAMEKSVGLIRIYIGKKIPRILRKLKNLNFHKHYSRGYYRLIKDPSFVSMPIVDDYIYPHEVDYSELNIETLIQTFNEYFNQKKIK